MHVGRDRSPDAGYCHADINWTTLFGSFIESTDECQELCEIECDTSLIEHRRRIGKASGSSVASPVSSVHLSAPRCLQLRARPRCAPPHPGDGVEATASRRALRRICSSPGRRSGAGVVRRVAPPPPRKADGSRCRNGHKTPIGTDRYLMRRKRGWGNRRDQIAKAGVASGT